jgi:hypothetical protein
MSSTEKAVATSAWNKVERVITLPGGVTQVFADISGLAALTRRSIQRAEFISAKSPKHRYSLKAAALYLREYSRTRTSSVKAARTTAQIA